MGCACDDYASAANQKRTFRGANGFDGGLGRARFRRRPPSRVTAMIFIGPNVLRIHFVVLNVVGHAQMRRSRPTRRHGAEGPTHHPRNMVGAFDDGVPLGERPHQRILIDFGQWEFAVGRDGNVRRYSQNRRGRLAGLDQAREQIGRASP